MCKISEKNIHCCPRNASIGCPLEPSANAHSAIPLVRMRLARQRTANRVNEARTSRHEPRAVHSLRSGSRVFSRSDPILDSWVGVTPPPHLCVPRADLGKVRRRSRLGAQSGRSQDSARARRGRFWFCSEKFNSSPRVCTKFLLITFAVKDHTHNWSEYGNLRAELPIRAEGERCIPT